MKHLLFILLLLVANLSSNFQSARLMIPTANAVEIGAVLDQDVEDTPFPDQLHSTEIILKPPVLVSDFFEFRDANPPLSLLLEHYPIRAPPLA